MPAQTRRRSYPPGWENPAETPAYFIWEAAHYLSLPPRTVRDWVLGRTYPAGGVRKDWPPLIQPADPAGELLSFLNLVELHVIASIRRVHLLRPKPVRYAINYLRKAFNSKHPLLDQQMLTDGKGLFIERYGSMVDISSDGQMYLETFMDAYLKRIEWDESHIPIRLFPFTRKPTVEASPQYVVIDPRIRSGKPCIDGTGVTTSIVYDRYRAGDSIGSLATDYGRPREEIEEAIRYESRAAA
jgi:uncharacterized protein (DUF433 family)